MNMPTDSSVPDQMERFTPDHVGSIVPVIFFNSTVLKMEQSITLWMLANETNLNSVDLHETEKEYDAQAPLSPLGQLHLR